MHLGSVPFARRIPCAVVAALWLAGCGDDGGEESAPDEPAIGQAMAVSEPGATPVPVVDEPAIDATPTPASVSDPVPEPEPEPEPVTEVRCGPFDDAERDHMLALVNDARARARSCGSQRYPAVPPLAWSTELERAAAGHSDDMAVHDFFSHTGSDGSTPGVRATRAGFAWNAIGENIAAGQRTAAGAVAVWIDSPGHCVNLMGADFTSLGMACTADPGASYPSYWTQVLGRSR